ncbi:MarR family winged helix-turn-helix transcriptional regulator [Nitrospirillum sp. BR 11163]|uniref:MarR family winged helix-turn-helix transcriptional regulator n=1 Tax=Nitrospirillum sp. BR 11163 TaxID=3104323 RepID=UPI002AFFEC66|nr:MarR family winged helix-turn-helix transcriptional regulator [Nitrospirillum sp. BR 11163]MEA1672787.1 MarR family winged helix-turn-helix transcriptional regulator [Nitrospirillum sp. BR 11163]
MSSFICDGIRLTWQQFFLQSLDYLHDRSYCRASARTFAPVLQIFAHGFAAGEGGCHAAFPAGVAAFRDNRAAMAGAACSAECRAGSHRAGWGDPSAGIEFSRILQDLERRGLVKRRTSAEDMRQFLVSVTPEGAELLADVGGYSEAIYGQLTARLGAERLQTLLQLLKDLEGDLNEGPSISDQFDFDESSKRE